MSATVTARPATPSPTTRRIQNAAPTTKQVGQTISAAQKLPGQVRALRDAYVDRPRNLRQVGEQTARNFRREMSAAAQGSPDVLDRNQVAGRAVRLASAASTASNLPQTLREAGNDLSRAFETGSRADIEKAVSSSTRAVADVASTANNVGQLARDVNRFAQPYRAARNAALARAPGAPAAARAAARRAALDSMRLRINDGRIQFQRGRPTAAQMRERARAAAARRAPTQAAQNAAQSAGQSAARRAPAQAAQATQAARGAQNAAQSAGQAAARRAPATAAQIQRAADAASDAARVAARRTAASAGARFLGRMTPGVNVALAAQDVARAYEAYRDPNASVGRRVTSTVTAIASVAAASNIPVVSQVGAVVSTLSSWVGSWFS